MSARMLALAALLLVLPAPPATLARPAERASPIASLRVVGRVTDAASGAALDGVGVHVAGTSRGGLTRADGRYALALADAWLGREVTLRFERIGMTGAERTLVLAAGDNVLDVALEPEALALDETLVTGQAGQAGQAGMARRREMASVVAPTAQPQAFPGRSPGDFNTEGYARIEENDFLPARGHRLSTFSIDVDRASYANVRRFIRDGQRPPVDAVRIEELINYFTYADPSPRGEVPFSVTTEVAPAPWQPRHRLVRIALRSRALDVEDLPPNNLVFLIDVSGSMQSPDKLPLVKTSLRMLVEQLRPEDRVALVVYAGAAGLVLPPTSIRDRAAILEAIDRLEAGGSTAGGAGLRLAYEVAARHHLALGNNRVILATDGDFNVGASSDAEMVRLIEEKRGQGTYLTVLGFGTGNLKDSKMEQLADHGNGNFAYIDGLLEAKKALVTEIGGTLLTVAQDVKIQVEMNPERVAAYRLIGYENRLLADRDFNDDTRDAGEIGAGHSVVALYEVVPVGVEGTVAVGGVDPPRYGSGEAGPSGSSPELLFVKVRYKEPGAAESRLLEHPVRDDGGRASTELRFAAAVAAWGMLLRESPHVGDFTLAGVERLASRSLGEDREGYRAEFVELVQAARAMELLARSR